MEFHLSFPPTVATIVFVIVIAILLQILERKKANRRKKKEAPQANGAWPIIGHLHLLLGGSQPAQRVLGDMAEIYGSIFTINLGVHQALVVSNHEIAKECYTTNDKVFLSRPKAVATELMGYNYAMFGLAAYGDYWRQVRKIIMLEVLSQRRVQMLGHVRVSELRASMKDLYEAWVNNKDRAEGLDIMVKVDMNQWFGHLVLNILLRVISGKRFSPDDEEGILFLKVARRLLELFGAFVMSDFIPYIKRLDLGGYQKEMKMTAKEIDIIIERLLEEHKGEQQNKGNQVFMDVLISILEGSSQDDFSGFDHDSVIKSSCLAILTAGLDTMSVTLTWALSLLLNNPKALEIAEDEIDEHVGRERMIEESDMKNLVYTKAIIKETLRLYPAAPLSVPRESLEDCIVSGYNIPKGTRLLVNLWKMHRDPNIWPDPNEFQPERFLTSQKDIDVKGKHYELLPFGSGRRMCPGVFLAIQTLPLILAGLIQQFTLRKLSNEPVDMSECAGLTTSKALPLEVLLAPRLTHNMYHINA
ncbi:hypothetical protein L6452_06597 [Arctium lappa]|uniref:Uncharacterized protein n=1 Tax=Arctium lappa TaxID=4217 RepID=A0ACB9EJ62_ARCLA|nr:hypothetical protein L6452_06597 [Arctium lappa]